MPDGRVAPLVLVEVRGDGMSGLGFSGVTYG